MSQCFCGRVKAQYIDNLNVEWNGHGWLLGINNSSLITALTSQFKDGDHADGSGRSFEAFVLPMLTKSVKLISEGK